MRGREGRKVLVVVGFVAGGWGWCRRVAGGRGLLCGLPLLGVWWLGGGRGGGEEMLVGGLVDGLQRR